MTLWPITLCKVYKIVYKIWIASCFVMMQRLSRCSFRDKGRSSASMILIWQVAGKNWTRRYADGICTNTTLQGQGESRQFAQSKHTHPIIISYVVFVRWPHVSRDATSLNVTWKTWMIKTPDNHMHGRRLCVVYFVCELTTFVSSFPCIFLYKYHQRNACCTVGSKTHKLIESFSSQDIPSLGDS